MQSAADLPLSSAGSDEPRWRATVRDGTGGRCGQAVGGGWVARGARVWASAGVSMKRRRSGCAGRASSVTVRWSSPAIGCTTCRGRGWHAATSWRDQSCSNSGLTLHSRALRKSPSSARRFRPAPKWSRQHRASRRRHSSENCGGPARAGRVRARSAGGGVVAAPCRRTAQSCTSTNRRPRRPPHHRAAARAASP